MYILPHSTYYAPLGCTNDYIFPQQKQAPSQPRQLQEVGRMPSGESAAVGSSSLGVSRSQPKAVKVDFEDGGIFRAMLIFSPKKADASRCQLMSG